MTTPCAPCALRGLGNLGSLQGLGQTQLPPETQRDLVSGAVAFTVPLAYHFAAPKKWPRGGMLVNVGAVVGLYFATRWVWQKLAPVGV